MFYKLTESGPTLTDMALSIESKSILMQRQAQKKSLLPIGIAALREETSKAAANVP